LPTKYVKKLVRFTLLSGNNNNNNNNKKKKKKKKKKQKKKMKKETILKYKDLTIQIQRMWNVKTKAIPVIIGATGTISK